MVSVIHKVKSLGKIIKLIPEIDAKLNRIEDKLVAEMEAPPAVTFADTVGSKTNTPACSQKHPEIPAQAEVRSVSPSKSGENTAQPATFKNDSLARAVVLNSNEDKLNSEVLSLLLKTIFEPHPQFVDYVSSKLDANIVNANILEAEGSIEKIVLRAVASREPGADLMASDFFAHKVRTAANQRAYSPAGRVRPDALFWPDPTHTSHPRSLFTEDLAVRKFPLITKKTAIASAGSCFAMEIAYALQREGYNYLVKEPNAADDLSYWFKDHEIRPYPVASAAWGIHFNSVSFTHLVEKAFGHRRPAKILWTNTTASGQTVYCDPFREELEFPSIEAFEKNYDVHLKAVRDVFLETDILVITLGLNELWYFKPDGSVFSRSPWRTAPSLVEHRTLTVEENVQTLQRMLDILVENNPSIKVIVTVSPVPLHATFLGDEKHIIEANCHSKSVLRVAAEEFTSRNENVYYFPSYEVVTNCVENPWDDDQRHVSRKAVDRVMQLFKKMYCAE